MGGALARNRYRVAPVDVPQLPVHELHRVDTHEFVNKVLSATSRRSHRIFSFLPRLVLDQLASRRHDAVLQSAEGSNNGPIVHQFAGAVLFVDISGFSAACEDLVAADLSRGVEQISEIVSRYFDPIIQTIYYFNGDVCNFAGDALICIFGGKSSDSGATEEQCALQAICCAQEISSKYSTFDAFGHHLGLHLGIASGMLSSVIAGSPTHGWNHLCVGQPLSELNTALPQSKNAEVMVTSRTAHLLCKSSTYKKCLRTKRAGHAFQVQLLAKGSKTLQSLLLTTSQDDAAIPHSMLEDQKHMRDSAVSFLPPVLRNSLDSFNIDLLSDIRKVTSLFISLTPAVDPRYLAKGDLSVLQRSFKIIQSQVVQNGGQINQILADEKGCSVVAVFGLPSSSSATSVLKMGSASSAQLACSAAASIFEALYDTFNLRTFIGIATSHIFTGIIGNECRHDFAVLGSGVNLAARLRSHAEKHLSGRAHVLCDQATLELANQYQLQQFSSLSDGQRTSQKWLVFDSDLPAAKLKGFVNPVPIFKPYFGPFSPPESSEPQISLGELEVHGREAELKQIKNHIECCLDAGSQQQAGSKRLIFIEGESGVGKDALAAYAVQQLDQQKQQFMMFQTSIGVAEKTTPWNMWTSTCLQMLSSVAGTSNVEEAPGLLLQFARQNLNEWIDLMPLISEIVPQLKFQETAQSAKFVGRDRNNKAMDLFIAICNSQQSNKLFYVSDLHNGDILSLQFLERLLQRVHSLVVLATVRKQDEAGAATTVSSKDKKLHEEIQQQLYKLRNQYSLVIELQPLSDFALEEIVCAKLGATVVEPELLQTLIEKSNKNPFMIIEISQQLKNSGQVIVDTEMCQLAPSVSSVRELNITNTVSDMILAKIDALGNDQKMLLKCASVFNGVFSAEVLGVLAESVPKTKLQTLVDELITSDYFMKINQGTELQFKSSMTCEAVYDSLLHKQKAMLHQQVAEYFEGCALRDASSKDTLTAKIALHLFKAIQEFDSKDVKLVVHGIEAQIIAGQLAFRKAMFAGACAAYDRAQSLLDRFPLQQTVTHVQSLVGQTKPIAGSSRRGSVAFQLNSSGSSKSLSKYSSFKKDALVLESLELSSSCSSLTKTDNNNMADVEAQDILGEPQDGDDDETSTTFDDDEMKSSISNTESVISMDVVMAAGIKQEHIRQLKILAAVGRGAVAYMTEGFTSPLSVKLYRRALKLIQHDDTQTRTSVICSWHLGISAIFRGETEKMDKFFKFCMKSALKCDDIAMVIQAHHLIWTWTFVAGRFSDVLPRAHFVIRAFKPEVHGKMVNEFNHDALICALCHASWSHFFMGNYVRSKETVDLFFQAVSGIVHPGSKGHAYAYFALNLCFQGDFKTVKEVCSKNAVFAQQYGMTQWEAIFLMLEAWSNYRLSEDLDDKMRAIDSMEQALNTLTNKVKMRYQLVLYQVVLVQSVIQIITPQNFDMLYMKADELLHLAIDRRGSQVYLDSILHSVTAMLVVCRLERTAHLQRTAGDDGSFLSALMMDMQSFLSHHEQSIRIATEQMAVDLVVRSLVAAIGGCRRILALFDEFCQKSPQADELKEKLQRWANGKLNMLCDTFSQVELFEGQILQDYLAQAQSFVHEHSATVPALN